MSSKSDLIDISCALIHETAWALLVSDGGVDKVWLPKSQIEYVKNNNGLLEITLPEWLAIEKGLV